MESFDHDIILYLLVFNTRGGKLLDRNVWNTTFPKQYTIAIGPGFPPKLNGKTLAEDNAYLGLEKSFW